MTPAQKFQAARDDIERLTARLIDIVTDDATSKQDLDMRLKLLAFELARRAGHLPVVMRKIRAIDDDDFESLAEELANCLVKSARLETAPQPSFDWWKFKERVIGRFPVTMTKADAFDTKAKGK